MAAKHIVRLTPLLCSQQLPEQACTQGDSQTSVRLHGHHLQAMAEQVESRVDRIRALGSQSGEARLLLQAALLMADDLHGQRLQMQEIPC